VQFRRKVLVVLCGCGNRDGSEIHESVCALIALEEAGLEAVCAAPDIAQARNASYVPGREPTARNAFEEAARLARGNIRPLAGLSMEAFDALLLPGGQGASQTLSTYAVDGTGMTVLSDVRRLVEEALASGKPIAAMCIAPMILARLIPGVVITLGGDNQESADAQAMGAETVVCPAGAAVVDPVRKVTTTPAYMTAVGPSEVLSGARSLVAKLLALLG